MMSHELSAALLNPLALVLVVYVGRGCLISELGIGHGLGIMTVLEPP